MKYGKCTCPKDFPKCVCGAETLGKIITKKPIEPTTQEREENSRSASAKLRIFERMQINKYNYKNAKEKGGETNGI